MEYIMAKMLQKVESTDAGVKEMRVIPFKTPRRMDIVWPSLLEVVRSFLTKNLQVPRMNRMRSKLTQRE